jgi:shikimate dehydrogenase
MGLASLRSAAVDQSNGEAAVAVLAWARAAGCTHALDGLGMLVEQAAESFLLWHGLRPETDGVYAALSGQADALVTAD